MSGTGFVERVRTAARDHLSGRPRRLGRWVYDRYREYDADRAFGRRTLPEDPGVPDGPRHVVFVVVDALRGDFDRDAAPYVDGLDGTTAVAPAPWTYPSVASMLSGRYPHEHGAIRQDDAPDHGGGDDVTLPPEMGADVTTLPEVLEGAGVETFGAFGFTMPFLASRGRFRTHRLFDQVPASRVLDAYWDWRSDREDRRTFAYLHLFDLHGPFEDTPPPEYWTAHDVDRSVPDVEGWRFTDQWEGEAVERYQTHRRRLYRAALDYVDDELRAFDAELRDRSASSALVLAGDHGEAFWEWSAFDAERFVDSRPAYGVGHGGTPYEAVARVPLRSRGLSTFEAPASLVDVAPSLLDDVGLSAPEGMSGHSHGTAVPDGRVLLTESARYGHEKKAAYGDEWKLLVSRGDDQRVGFRLPAESVADLPEDVARRLEAALPEWPGDGDGRAVSGRVRERLEDLGYA